MNEDSVFQFEFNSNQFKKENCSYFNKLKVYFIQFYFMFVVYFKNILQEIKKKILFIKNYFVFWILFLINYVFHYIILKFLLPRDIKKKNLIRWISKKTNNYLVIKSNSFHELFCNGKKLCALIEHLCPNSCPRYDLLDEKDLEINLNLAFKLIFKNFGIDEKIYSFNLKNDELENKIIDLLVKIKYYETKKDLYLLLRKIYYLPQFDIEKIEEQDNYLIKGMGICVGVCNRVAYFNIYYFRCLDIVIEIIGPENSYCCERIKQADYLYKNKKNLNYNKLNGKKEEIKIKNKIQIKFKLKKQMIEISYIPIKSGIHSLSIVHEGRNILNSPYNVLIDENK